MELGVVRSSTELHSPPRSIGRSESFSPVSTSSVIPLGSHEQRASLRRYEFERMEPRKLPENAESQADLSSPSINPTPPPIPPKKPGTPMEKLLANKNFGTREQRGSLRKVQRAKVTSTPTSSAGSANSSPSLNRQGAIIRREENDTGSPLLERQASASIKKANDGDADPSPAFRRQEVIRRSDRSKSKQKQDPPPPTSPSSSSSKQTAAWYEYGSV